MPNSVKRLLAFAFAGSALMVLARFNGHMAVLIASTLLLGVVLLNPKEITTLLDGIGASFKFQ